MNAAENGVQQEFVRKFPLSFKYTRNVNFYKGRMIIAKKREAHKQLTNRNQTFFSTLDDQEVRDYPGGLIDALRSKTFLKKLAIIMIANKLLKEGFGRGKKQIFVLRIITSFIWIYPWFPLPFI